MTLANSPPCNSAAEYYNRVYKTHLDNALKGPNHVQQAIAWLFYESSQHILRSSPETGQFPLCQGDFTSANFIWDTDFNLKAVIDWTNSMTLPCPMVGVLYEFHCDDSDGVQEARAQFFEIVSAEEIRLGFDNRVSSLLVSPLAEILTIIRECDRDSSAIMYHIPRLLKLLPETLDASYLDQLCPGFINQAIKLRAEIDAH